MSQNQHYRAAWCEAMFIKAAAMFHRARKEAEHVEKPLSDLARMCANTVMEDNAHTIVGDKEACARAFMTKCRESFPGEIAQALAEMPVEQRPEEARVM